MVFSFIQWVCDVVNDLLPLGEGVYSGDLGPDPGDSVLAARAFGSNATRLGRLKRDMDPRNVLAYACPLLKTPFPQLIIFVPGRAILAKTTVLKQGFLRSAVAKRQSSALNADCNVPWASATPPSANMQSILAWI